MGCVRPGEGVVAERELYLSYGLQAVDAKGRVAVPATLRAALEANSPSRSLFVGRHESHQCLSGFDAAWPAILHSRLDPRELSREDSGGVADYNLTGTAFGDLEAAAYDSAGRFVIPPFFRRIARIEKWAFFHGRGNTFNIWNPHHMLADDSIADQTRELVRWALEEKGAL